MIPRGTTPTIDFTFQTVSPAEITVAYLTIEQNEVKVLERDLTSATVGEHDIAWKLTQTETLKINERVNLRIQIRYKLSDGSAYASQVFNVSPYEILKDGEI